MSEIVSDVNQWLQTLAYLATVVALPVVLFIWKKFDGVVRKIDEETQLWREELSNHKSDHLGALGQLHERVNSMRDEKHQGDLFLRDNYTKAQDLEKLLSVWFERVTVRFDVMLNALDARVEDIHQDIHHIRDSKNSSRGDT